MFGAGELACLWCMIKTATCGVIAVFMFFLVASNPEINDYDYNGDGSISISAKDINEMLGWNKCETKNFNMLLYKITLIVTIICIIYGFVRFIKRIQNTTQQ